MPYWIEGWVEVARAPVEVADEHAWQGVIRLHPLIDVADEVSERLFGLSKRASSSSDANSQAGGRGIPRFISQQLAQELRLQQPFIESGEVGGFTWAMWPEVWEFRRLNGYCDTSAWKLPFDLVDRLVMAPGFGAERVRIVVWYNW